MLKIKHKLSCCVLVKIIIFLLLLFLVKSYLASSINKSDSEMIKGDIPQEDIFHEIFNIIYDDMHTFLPQQNEDDFRYEEGEIGNLANFDIGKYNYKIETEHINNDYDGYITTLLVYDGKKELDSVEYDEFFPRTSYRLETKSQVTHIIKIDSLGAHCCTSLIPITMKNDRFFVGKPLDLGNTNTAKKSDFFVRDNKLYIVVSDDRFAYYQMSFGESTNMFYPSIYLVDEKGFSSASEQFGEYYEKLYISINRQMTKLDPYQIDFDDYYHQSNLISVSILRYAMGYLAGHSRQDLRHELLSSQPEGFFNEQVIFNNISDQNNPFVYYAKLNVVSDSGETIFFIFDNELNKINDRDNNGTRFVAMPANVLKDDKLANRWVNFIHENSDSVFKITGLYGNREEGDDCGYSNSPKHCFIDLDVKTIEVVGENKIMEF